MKQFKNTIIQSLPTIFGSIPFVICLAVVIYPFRQAYKATPRISAIADIFESADPIDFMAEVDKRHIYPRSTYFTRLIETDNPFEDFFVAEASRARLLNYYPWEGQAFEFQEAKPEWETVKSQYEKAFRQLHFTKVRSEVEIRDGYRVIFWERDRYFGMEGELVALIWNEDLDIERDMFLLLGIDR